MSNIIKTAQKHRFITTGVLGTVALGGTALIGASAIAFLMVAGKFPPVHLSGLKMMLPVSLAGGVGVGLGVTVELVVLGITVVLLLKKRDTESKHSSTQDEKLSLNRNEKVNWVDVTKKWLTTDDTYGSSSDAFSVYLPEILEVDSILQNGDLAIWKNVGQILGEKSTFLFYKQGNTIRFKYIKDTELDADKDAIALLAARDDSQQSVVDIANVIHCARNEVISHSNKIDSVKGSQFIDGRSKRWNIRSLGKTEHTLVGFTLKSDSNKRYVITPQKEPQDI